MFAKGCEGVRLVPQPVGDGLGETEQLGGDGAEVNRVVVAGNPCITAADIGGGFPAGQFADLGRGGLGVIFGFAFQLYAPSQNAAFGFP